MKPLYARPSWRVVQPFLPKGESENMYPPASRMIIDAVPSSIRVWFKPGFRLDKLYNSQSPADVGREKRGNVNIPGSRDTRQLQTVPGGPSRRPTVCQVRFTTDTPPCRDYVLHRYALVPPLCVGCCWVVNFPAHVLRCLFR